MTFSIVGRCATTGQIGVAVASHALAVGRTVPWARAGVGVVATQALPGCWYGPGLLDDIEGGVHPQTALARRLTEDAGRETRQIIAIDVSGRIAQHSGRRCIGAAQLAHAEDAVAAGNMLVSERVVDGILSAFARSEGSLGSRLVTALAAGEAVGGDLRGPQAAAVIVVAANATGDPAVDVLIDLRVDDHVAPIGEMTRLVALAKADAHWRSAIVGAMFGAEPNEDIFAKLQEAQLTFADNPEPEFWETVVLAIAGRRADATARLAGLEARNAGWVQLFANLVSSGILPADRTRVGPDA